MSSYAKNPNYSKLCIYGCGIHIYWNTSKKAFYDVETDNRHLCPNSTKPTTRQTRPTYYKSLIQSQTEQHNRKMSNSIQILLGRAEEVRKQYEYLNDVINDCNGKTQGSHLIL